MRYQIIEDNGGGLHCFVWTHNNRGSDITWGCYNLEHISSTDFLNTLAYIESGEARIGELRRWDSLYDDPRAAYEALTAHRYGYDLIAENANGQRTTYPERMGAAGRLAFDLRD